MQLKFYHLLKQMLIGWTMRSTGRCLEFLAVPVLLISLTVYIREAVNIFRCYRLRGMQIQELSETIFYMFFMVLYGAELC